MSRLMPYLWVPLTLVAAACGGGNGSGPDNPLGPGAYCTSVGGAVTTTADPACSNCAIANAPNAADGDLATYATISMNQDASGAGPAIRATGASQPSGTNAGAWVHIPQGAQGWTVTVKTYLNGAPQQSNTVPSTAPAGSPAFDDYFSVATTLSFDAVEVQVADANFNPVPISFLVYELCTDGGVH